MLSLAKAWQKPVLILTCQDITMDIIPPKYCQTVRQPLASIPCTQKIKVENRKNIRTNIAHIAYSISILRLNHAEHKLSY